MSSNLMDIHMHTTVSDGTDSPLELAEKVEKQGLRYFSITDHDDIEGSLQVMKERPEGGPVFIPGVEFSSRDAHGKYHILGYGYDPEGESIRELVQYAHRLRIDKVKRRIDALLEKGYYFSQKEIEKLLSNPNPGKPHIGNLMVRLGYAETKDLAIKKILNPLHVSGKRVSPEEVIEAILGSGGVPVLAHPLFGSGSQNLSPEEMEQRIRRLKEMGIEGVEVFYSRFSEKQTMLMLSLAEKYNLYVTAGSDYHGTNKTVKIGQTNLPEAEDMPAGMRAFLRRVTEQGL